LPSGNVTEYSYDVNSRVTEIKYKRGTTFLGNLTYEYDKDGKRTKTGGSYGRTGIPQAVNTTTYNVNNQQTVFGDKILTYDNNGNLLSSTDSAGTTNYTWNARNLLTGITGPGVSASFVYDAIGRRIRKTINGVTTEFLHDGVNPVQELSGGSVVANLLTGRGMVWLGSNLDFANRILFVLNEMTMARPLRILYPNAFYHVTCRGNDRQVIFRDDHDRRRFLERLRSASVIFSVRVHAYVLMSNHFHLIVETPKANLSEFMRQFNISYTSYYNRRHRRIGHLYQGRFKAILVDQDSYLLELSRYVHLNPIRIRSKAQRSESERIREISRYRWSSLPGYVDGKRKDSWITYEAVLGYVGESRHKYAGFVEEGIRQGIAPHGTTFWPRWC
jgi:YD repeat-containing protein